MYLAGPSYRRARSGAKLIRLVEFICFAPIVVNAVYLAASCMEGLTSRVVLGEGGADFDRRQSVFGLTRARRERNAGIERASGDRTGHRRGARRAVAQPHHVRTQGRHARLRCAARDALVYMYDLVLLAVAVAYLLRDGIEWGFPSLDGTALAAAAVLVLIYPYVPTKVGLAAVLIIAGLTASRTCCVAARTASH